MQLRLPLQSKDDVTTFFAIPAFNEARIDQGNHDSTIQNDRGQIM